MGSQLNSPWCVLNGLFSRSRKIQPTMTQSSRSNNSVNTWPIHGCSGKNNNTISRKILVHTNVKM